MQKARRSRRFAAYVGARARVYVDTMRANHALTTLCAETRLHMKLLSGVLAAANNNDKLIWRACASIASAFRFICKKRRYVILDRWRANARRPSIGWSSREHAPVSQCGVCPLRPIARGGDDGDGSGGNGQPDD